MVDYLKEDMKTIDYLREEGQHYYLNEPGVAWIVLLLSFLGVFFFNCLFDSSCTLDTVGPFFMILPTVTGILAAIGVTAITFQLGTFTVEELRNFVLDTDSMKQFRIMRTAAHWTISVLMGSFLSGIIVLILSKVNWISSSRVGQSLLLFVALAILGFAIGHARFAARAAFDFANFKVAIAQAIEEETIKREQKTPNNNL